MADKYIPLRVSASTRIESNLRERTKQTQQQKIISDPDGDQQRQRQRHQQQQQQHQRVLPLLDRQDDPSKADGSCNDSYGGYGDVGDNSWLHGDVEVLGVDNKHGRTSDVSRISWLFVIAMSMLIGFILFGTGIISTGAITSRNNISRPTLHFREEQSDGNENETDDNDDNSKNKQLKFRIAQITDIHLGEAEDTNWGPQQDVNTWKGLDTILTMEYPDLIVLSGDQLTANNCKDNGTAYYEELGNFLSNYHQRKNTDDGDDDDDNDGGNPIPWAMIFGNHDDTDYVTETEETVPAKYSRDDLLSIDQTFPQSLTQRGPDNVFGTTNYVVDVRYPTKNDKVNRRRMTQGHQGDDDDDVAARIYFLDSGGGQLPKSIDDSQISWIQKKLYQSEKKNIPGIVFQHIPTQQHTYTSSSCYGYQGEGIDPIDTDGGIVDVLAATGVHIAFLATGHNHGNDYCCRYNGQNSTTGNNNNTDDTSSSSSSLHLCFGRHSGHGGYGGWTRGVRMYELTLPLTTASSTKNYNNDDDDDNNNNNGQNHNMNNNNNILQWVSWVRLETGEVVDKFSPQQQQEEE